MKYTRPPAKHIEIPVASLGDIAFLLITFFMFCSTFSRTGGGKIAPPQSPHLTQLLEGKVSVDIDEEGKIYVQGQIVPDANAVETSVGILIEGATTDQGKTVMFKCDKHITKQIFEPVLGAIAKAGATIAALGDRPTEKQEAQP